MPYAVVKLRPGIDVELTPLLNEAGWSFSQNIRFFEGLPQKIGGWVPLNTTPIIGTGRGMHAWADLTSIPYAAVGTEQRVELFTSGRTIDITPLRAVSDIAPSFSTVSGDDSVKITDSANGVSAGDWINVWVQVSVGGLIIFGFYQVDSVIDASNFTIVASSLATSTINNGGAVPSFSVSGAGQTVTTVTLDDHGLIDGNVFTVQIATNVGGLSIPAGVYVVSGVTTNTFTISPGGTSTRAATTSENGGLAEIQYLIATGLSSNTPLTGYGIGLYGVGLYGVSNGSSIAALRQWFLDNWGQDLTGNFTASTIYYWVPPISMRNIMIPLGSSFASAATVQTAQSGAGSYAPADIVALDGGTYTEQALLSVTTTKAISATIAHGGSGGSDGTRTVTGTTGTGTKFQASVTVSGGAITAVLSITVAGSYTVNPTTLTDEPVTGASLTGAALNVVMGVLSASMLVVGVYSDTPSNPVAQAWTSGSGTGAAFNLTFAGGGIDVPDTVNISFVAAPQQIMIALGADPPGANELDPNLVRWSNVADFSDWLATATNQAGSFRIPSGSRIVGGIQSLLHIVIWTDVDMWVMDYIGFPEVFGFNKISAGVDLLAAQACVLYKGSVYWAASNGFFRFDGNQVSIIPCPVWDKFWFNLNRQQKDKVFAASNAYFQEISWWYPSASGNGEVDSRVTYNIREDSWTYDTPSTFQRTCWVDDNVFGSPIGVDLSGLLQQHEVGADANGQSIVSYARSGWFSISEGSLFAFLERLIPEMIVTGGSRTIQITIFSQDFPTDPEQQYGPFNWSAVQGPQFQIIRARNRVISIQVGSSDLGIFWRLGAIRYLASPAGRR